MSKLHSYNKIYNISHARVKDVLRGRVRVEEKVDGSQISFGVIDGELHARSKGVAIDLNHPQKLFAPAVEYIKSIKDLLTEGAVYRGETLYKEKHNVIKYDRVPRNHIVLYDIEEGEQGFVSREELETEARTLDLEVVPLLYDGECSVDMLKQLLDLTSFLGCQKIEGVVIKSYDKWIDGETHLAMAKLVSDDFKEKHSSTYKNNGSTDCRKNLFLQYKTDARWNKAIQHLTDSGVLKHSPSDIGKLIKEIQRDTLEEYKDEIKDSLFKIYERELRKILVSGFPEYYLNKLEGE